MRSAIVRSVEALGIEVRAGVHTGEVESIAGKAGGLAVVIGARIGALAGASEVLVDRELKGVPGHWRINRFVPETA